MTLAPFSAHFGADFPNGASELGDRGGVGGIFPVTAMPGLKGDLP